MFSVCRDQPQIMDYMKLKRHVADLEKEVADWQRKLEVTKGAANSLRKTEAIVTR